MSNKINFLPPWAETNLQPAFYDVESGTVLQQTARMYDKVNQLVRNVNVQNETIDDYVQQFIELHDYVDDYFDNLDVQQEIDNKLDEMAEDGELKNIFQLFLSDELEEINEKIDEAIERQDTYIENSLENTKSGAPIPVASTGAMTDTSRVYLNTTDGKWYYYNGEDWTIGGTYQATGLASGSVDGFELNSYAKVDTFETVTQSTVAWGCEGIYNGNNVNASDAIDTLEYLLFDAGDIITLVDDENYKIRVAQYNRATKAYVSSTNMLTTSYTIPARNYYRIQISSLDGTRPDPSNISSIITFTALEDKQIKPINYGDLDFVSCRKIGSEELELGSIGDNGQNTSSNGRIRTIDYIQVKKGMMFNLRGETGLYFVIKGYDAEKSFTGDVTSGWMLNGENHFYKLDFNGYMRIILKQSTNANMTSGDVDVFDDDIEVYSNLPDSLGFEMDSEVDLSDVVMRNSNNLSVSAHRGQFGNDYPENTIVAYTVATENQFDYIETDVRFTSDGIAVICHDDTINRTARYANGDELVSPVYVSQKTYSYLADFDYGIYKGETYAGTPLLTFDDVCKFAKFYNVKVNIDLKSNTDANILTAINIVKKYGLTNYVKWTVDNINTARYILNVLPKSVVRLGAWTPSATTVNNVLTLISEYPSADIGIDVYVGNTTDEIFASIQSNALTCSIYCENTSHLTRGVMNGATEVTCNNVLPYATLKDYYDSL